MKAWRWVAAIAAAGTLLACTRADTAEPTRKGWEVRGELSASSLNLRVFYVQVPSGRWVQCVGTYHTISCDWGYRHVELP